MATSGEMRGHERHRKDRQIEEVVHDPYLDRHKPSGPAGRPGCGALFDGGHWHWMPVPAGAKTHLCPACHRAGGGSLYR